MNLKFHLLSRIILIAILCLIVTAAYVLYQSDRQAHRQALIAADSLSRQLEMQLLRIDAGFGDVQRFPDFDLWKQTGGVAGLCVRFMPVDGAPARSLCNGSRVMEPTWPVAFETFYRRVFSPGSGVNRAIVFKGRHYGSLTVTPAAEMGVAAAWLDIRNLLGLSAVTVLAICLLVYLSISRILRPAQVIVDGLERMKKGDLSVRLPGFDIAEWQRTATAINRLVAAQQQLLAERGKLAVKLMTLQDEERRYLARELHDELGQCLAAISAVAVSIEQGAQQECPALVPEARQISRITGHVMTSVRGLLLRLRPFEIDELGLADGLKSLTSTWNLHSGGKTHYQLTINGDCARVPEPLPATIFRIVQECLSNAAKHAGANNVKVTLGIGEEVITLIIADDGITDTLPYAESPGIGLLGIRERVTALAGQMRMATAQPHGLIIEIQLPFPPGQAVRQ